MILIKVGGGKLINWDYICEDIKILLRKEKIIIVHGANSLRDEIAEKMGHPTKRIISESGITSIYTDKEAMDIFTMVYAGLVNKNIVAKLQSYGINAVGLSGVDGKIWQAQRKKFIIARLSNKRKLIKGDFSGKVININKELINLLIDNNYVPVLTPPAISFEYEILNIDGDLASAMMAHTLQIEKLIYLFEAPGLLKKPEDEKTLVKRIKKNSILEYLPFAKGTMKKKILSAQKAIQNGVKTVYFGDGRQKNPIIKTLKGNGTVIGE